MALQSDKLSKRCFQRFVHKIYLSFLLVAVPIGCRDGTPPAHESNSGGDAASAIEGVMAFRFALGETSPIDGCSVTQLLHGDSSTLRRFTEAYPTTLLFGRGGGCAAADSAVAHKPRLFVESIQRSGRNLVLVARYRRGGSSHKETYELQQDARTALQGSPQVTYSVIGPTFSDFSESDIFPVHPPVRAAPGPNRPRATGLNE